jgi:hypothetical protein
MAYNLLEMNPLMHIFLLLLSDRSLIESRVDFFLWSVIISFQSIEKVFMMKVASVYKEVPSSRPAGSKQL